MGFTRQQLWWTAQHTLLPSFLVTLEHIFWFRLRGKGEYSPRLTSATGCCLPGITREKDFCPILPSVCALCFWAHRKAWLSWTLIFIPKVVSASGYWKLHCMIIPKLHVYTLSLKTVVQLVEISVGRWWCLLPSLLGGKRSDGRWISWHWEIWITLPTPALRNMALSRCWKLIFPYWNVRQQHGCLKVKLLRVYEKYHQKVSFSIKSELFHIQKRFPPLLHCQVNTKFYLEEGTEVALLSLTHYGRLNALDLAMKMPENTAEMKELWMFGSQNQHNLRIIS